MKIKSFILTIALLFTFYISFSQTKSKTPQKKVIHKNTRVNAIEDLFFGMPEDSVLFYMNGSGVFKIGNYAYSIRCNYNQSRLLSSISLTQLTQLFADSYDTDLKEIHNDLLSTLNMKYGNPTKKYGYPSYEKLLSINTMSTATNTWELIDKTIEIGVEEYNSSNYVWLSIKPN